MTRRNLRVCFPFVGDTVGGSHLSSWQLICALQEMSVETMILVHQKGKYLQWLEDQGGKCEIVELPYICPGLRSIYNWFRILSSTWSVRKLLRKLDIDLIHCNDSRMNATWAIWAKAANIPMVWHQRSTWSIGRQARVSLRFASGVISISQFIAKAVPHLSIPHRMIYNPVVMEQRDKADCAWQIREELGLSKDVQLIGCFGNSQAWKRPDTVVQAATILNKEFTNKIKILWCGDDRDGLLDRMLLLAGQSCPVLRIPFRSDVLTAMAGCNIVVAASEREPFGRSIVEAMSVGVPVVASNAGGHCEIIEHEKNGLLFPVGDEKACASAIIRLLKDEKLRQDFVKAGRETARRFDPMRHAREILDFYNQLLGMNNREAYDPRKHEY
ncbi:MAG: glycosyltransferase family 4 protein [Candidatus Loosdrechtia sp.]|uniref:glycosyltransferase family 4 protein n=1 Tax=Candidatus Loosdrechtia sp. TaxID=3101272 RepID=UPI003A6E2597|nr:MAG: glycosyltransferase family 4 protein [Candidatus Jettenia sp. AMX2]